MAEIIGQKPGMDYLMTVKETSRPCGEKYSNKILPRLGEVPHHVKEERRRGRVRRWSCWTADAEGVDFPHAGQVAFIRRDVFDISGDRISKECALVLTSRKAEEMTAAELKRHIRSHWGIENKSHYIRDTARREDASQAYAAAGPHALASLRNLAMGLFRLKGANAIKETTEWVSRDRMRALQLTTT